MAEATSMSLFRSEKWSASMYRVGLFLSAVSLIGAAVCLGIRIWGPTNVADLGELGLPMGSASLVNKLFISMLVNFAGGVGLCMIFLTLKNTTLLRILQILYIPGLFLLVAATVSVSQRYGAGPFAKYGSTLGVATMTLFYAVVILREARTFKFLEAYLVALGSLLIGSLLFATNADPKISFFAFAVTGAIGLVVALRKLGQPMAVDVVKGE